MRQGFTLLELIVCLAVIFGTMLVLMPVFQRALGRAHFAECSGHEKEIAVAMIVYADDNDGQFPPIEMVKDQLSWKDLVLPYLKKREGAEGETRAEQTLVCPSNPSRESKDNAGKLPVSYAFNSCASTWNPILNQDGTSAHPVGRIALRNSELAHPSATIMLGEVAYGTLDVSPSWAFSADTCDPTFQGYFEHERYPNSAVQSGGKANFVFFDGHVASNNYVGTILPASQSQWTIQEVDRGVTSVQDPEAPDCAYDGTASPLCGY